MDLHLLKVSQKLDKTVKVVRIHVSECPFLVQKFQIRVLPTLFLVRGGVIIKMMKGFEHIAQSNTIETSALLSWIIKRFELDTEDDYQSLL